MPGRGRLSVSPLSTPTWTLEEDLALAARLGLGRTSLALGKLLGDGPGDGPGAGLDRVRAAGLTVDVVYPGAGFDLDDPSRWAATRAELSAAVSVAADTGARAVMVNGAGRRLDHEGSARAFAAALAPLREEAAGRGVRLAVEPVRPQFAYAAFLHTLADGLALAEALDLDLVVDVTHCWWEPNLDRSLAAAAGRAATVHLADLRLDGPVIHRSVPGEGDLPLAAFVDRLLGAGYRGPFEIELTGPAADPEGTALVRAVDAVTALLDRAGPAG